MENYKLVLRGDLNQHGYLFGGNLLKWIDEYAWIAASLEFQGCNFVTIGMDHVIFKKSVKEGSILKFDIRKSKQGTTSVQYQVEVYCNNMDSRTAELVFSNQITFVRIDQNGNKIPITG